MPAAVYNNSALGPLLIPSFNYTTDALQVVNALTGLGRDLGSWTLRVANLLNSIVPGGVFPIPVSSGGTGLNSGTSGGVLYFSSTTTLASSALLQANALVLGGGAGGAPFTAVQASTPPAMLSYNAVFNLAAIVSPPTGTVLAAAAADGASTNLDLEAGAANPRITFYRANTQLGSPTGLNAVDPIGAIAWQGHDGVARSANAAQIFVVAANPWSAIDHSTNLVLRVTPKGSTTIGTVATFNAAADGGTVFVGCTDASSAAVGIVGEYLSSVVLIANEVNINAAANVVTLNLSPGDWDVSGELWVDNSTGAATLSGKLNAGITLSSATQPTVPADATAKNSYDSTLLTSGTAIIVLPVGPVRVNINSGAPVFLVGSATVSAGTMNAYGKLMARRVR